MNKLILNFALLFFAGNLSFGQTDISPTTMSFGVRGNCGMCKKTIENAASGVKGVQKADWNRETKVLSVTYAHWETEEISIHNAIAKVGYDTEKVVAPDKTYNALPGCCQYDRKMKINSKKEHRQVDHEGHGHHH